MVAMAGIKNWRMALMTGTELAKLRKKFKYSQRELATVMGIDSSTVGKYETGVIPISEHREEAIRRILKSGRTKEEVLAERTAKASTETVDPSKLTASSEKPLEVRVSHSVELGPETMRLLSEMIRSAVQSLELGPETIRAFADGVRGAICDPKTGMIRTEIIRSAIEGERYREKCRDAAMRG